MSRRKIEIVIAIIILLALIGLVVFLLTRDKTEGQGPQDGGEDATPTDELPPVEPEDVPAPQAVSAQTVSRVFVERFGSYSSESDFQNVADIMELATPALQLELESVVDLQRQTQGDAYYGVSTFVISSKVTAETDTTMTLMITTQRRESIGTPGNTSTRYQDIEVKLEKSGLAGEEKWLIADYTWQS